MDADAVVGRGTELATVEAALARVPGGLAGAVLTGEAGIGKSTLWDAGVEAARARGWLVLVARPAASEHSLTLAGLTDLLGPVDAAAFDALPPPQRTALEVALLRVEPTGAPPDQRTLSVAVTSLLRDLATGDRPLLLAIDDLQWLDPGSASILAFALRRAADRPVGLLASARAGEASKASDELLAAVPGDRIERVAVGPLHLAALHRLFEVRLGRSFPRVVLLRIEAASGGNPLYALELARALADVPSDVDVHAGLPVPESLAALIAGRVSRLPAGTRRAMLVAAAASDPTLATLEAVDPGIARELVPAIDDGLVSVDAGTVRFRHPLFAQSVTSLGPAADLRAVHGALAKASPSPDARARHLSRAADGPDEHVAAALAEAAAQARLRGATLDASSLYRESARLTPADRPVTALDRSRLAAECLFIDLSEYLEADRILETAIAAAPAGPARAEATSLRAILRYYHGRVPEAIELATGALAEAGADPGLRARILGRLAYLTMQLDLDRGLAQVDEAVAILDDAATRGRVDDDTLANVLLLRAVGSFGLVRPIPAGDVERGLRALAAAGRSWEKEGADGSAFGIARVTDDLDRAIEMTRVTIREKSGAGGDDPFNVVMLSGLLLFRGDWPEARRQAEAAMDDYRREGAEVHPAWALRGIALVAAHDGRPDEARRWAEEGLARAEERGDAVLAIFHRQILGFLALTREAWPDADTHLGAAAELATRMGVRHPGRFKIAGDQVEAALALGDTERAARVAAQLDEAARIAPSPWVRAVGLRSAGLVAAARGDLDIAATCLDSALEAHRDLPMPFERGRTLLARGRLHRRRKEKRLADETLRDALAVFESLGAPDWAAKARLELGRVGRRPHAPQTLTETELRVAELAATGLTSREIAERAFLAPKTVGNVLGRVYEKLGIHSRAELGAVMAAIAAAADVTSRTLD
jgi:DNA-binding CsgD family transcriptional regulator